MKRFLFSIFLLLSTELQAQQITTFILVRHAEKVADGSKDPELSDEGVKRSLRLVALLEKTNVDAVYSTAYKRTMNTVAPLAEAKGIAVRTYDPQKAGPIDEMLKNFPGGTIVICGHSNTIPWTANYLAGKESFKNFEDNDYGNVLIVEVAEKGKAKVVWLRY